MKITLAKKTYDTSNSQSLEALRQVLAELLEDKTENAAEIKSVKKQIEKEYFVSDAEIEVV